jgi:hypothetical protein
LQGQSIGMGHPWSKAVVGLPFWGEQDSRSWASKFLYHKQHP